ncbi:lysozyme [Sarracenia purpurea var. burkii]
MPINHVGFASYDDGVVNWSFPRPGNKDKCFKPRTSLTTRNYEYHAHLLDRYIQPGNIILVQFYVKAERDAHIVLAPTSKPAKYNERAYEIVLGCWNNTGATIRSVRGTVSKADHLGNNMLCAHEWRPFWIRVSPNGLIEVGKEIGSPPFMSWKDERPAFSYYSLASYDNGVVDWAFECSYSPCSIS